MSLPALDNLVRVGQLKAEPRNKAEARRMLALARTRLADARVFWKWKNLPSRSYAPLQRS